MYNARSIKSNYNSRWWIIVEWVAIFMCELSRVLSWWTESWGGEAGIAVNGERSTMYQQRLKESNACSMLLCYIGPSSNILVHYLTWWRWVPARLICDGAFCFFLVCIYIFEGTLHWAQRSLCRRYMSWVVIQSHLNWESILTIPPPLHLNLRTLGPAPVNQSKPKASDICVIPRSAPLAKPEPASVFSVNKWQDHRMFGMKFVGDKE